MLGIYFSLGVLGIECLAFVGGLIAVAAVYLIGSLLRSRDPILVLVLTGVVVGALLGAGVGLVKYLADPYNQLPAMTFWLLGSLAATAAADLLPLLGPVAIGTAVLVALRWRMNVMSLPEDEARALGVATGPLRIAIVVAATLVTSASVATSGIIGWVGLVVPHLARALVGPGLPAADPDRGAARRRLSPVHRHARAHRRAGRDSARHPHRRDRHAVLHLAAGRHAEAVVMSLAPCVPDPVQRERARSQDAQQVQLWSRANGAPLIRDRHKHRVLGGPGSAAHHFASLMLRCARDTCAECTLS